MIQRLLLTFLVATIAAALTGEARAADSSVTQQMNSGFTNPAPKPSLAKNAVSPTADQITATNAIGADVRDPNGTTAKITDISVDRHTGAAAVAIIALSGGKSFDHGKSAIAWSSLRFVPGPTPHFVTRLDQQALNAASSLVGPAKNGADYLDVKRDLLGKEVVGPNGNSLGHITNLVLTFGTGHIAAMVIDTRGGVITLAGERNRAVSWDAAKPEITQNGGPIRIVLSKQQVDSAPLTTSMAPAPVPSSAANRGQVVLQRDSTGNISGTKIPAPQDRR